MAETLAVKPKVYHFFHSGLEHHNQHMMTLFEEQYDAYQQFNVVTDPHGIINGKNAYQSRLTSLREYVRFIRAICAKRDVVIIHGLYTNWHYLLPVFCPSLAKRVIWDIWGDDFYSSRRLQSATSLKAKLTFLIRKYAVPKFSALSGFKEDVADVTSFFSFNGKIFYNNHPLRENLDKLNIEHREYSAEQRKRILIGNSGARSNEHLRGLELLQKCTDFTDFELVMIFSTDVNKDYLQEVLNYIEQHSIKNIEILTEMMSFNKFIDFMRAIDVVLLPHKRQQGVGTSNLSLMLAKPVYMDLSVSTANYYHDEGVTIFDIEQVAHMPHQKENIATLTGNVAKISSLFGRAAVKAKWKSVIESYVNG